MQPGHACHPAADSRVPVSPWYGRTGAAIVTAVLALATFDPLLAQPRSPRAAELEPERSADDGAPAPDDDMPLSPAKPPSVEYFPVPDEEARAKAEAQVKEVYGAERKNAKSPDQKLKLSKTLLEQGRATIDDTALRYVLLRDARDLAAEAGDLARATECLETLTTDYGLNPFAEKEALFTVINRQARAPAAARALTEAVEDAVRDAIKAEDYEAAARLAQLAVGAAKKARDPALLRKMQDLKRGVEARRGEQEARRAG